MKTNHIGVAALCLLSLAFTRAANATTYTYTYTGPSGGVSGQSAAEINEVAQFSLSAPLEANSTVWWSIPPVGLADPFPDIWLGGTISLEGAGTPANYSIPIQYLSLNTNAAGQIIDWYLLGNVFLPNNVHEQAYSINSRAAGQPPGVLLQLDYDQAVIVKGVPTFSWIFNPSNSVPGDWTETISAETPIPAALPLFATGLGVMGWFGWRRKRKPKAAI